MINHDHYEFTVIFHSFLSAKTTLLTAESLETITKPHIDKVFVKTSMESARYNVSYVFFLHIDKRPIFIRIHCKYNIKHQS